MKKRIYALSTLFLCILFSTGCGSVPELSNEQNNQIAEYMAASLLKYDANYDAALEYDESILDITPTPVPTEEPEPTKEPQSSDEPLTQPVSGGETSASATTAAVIAKDFSSVLGSNQYVVTAKSMEIMKHYKDAYTDVDAMEDMRLLVVTFKIENTSDSEIRVNMLDPDNPVNFTASVGGSAVKPLYTLVSNDLRYYKEKIPAGKSRSAVLLFEIGKDADVLDVTVTAASGDKHATVAVH